MYKIDRPPLLPTFYLPAREDLLKLKIGDEIKLIFTDENGNNGERMWVEITQIGGENGDMWEGKLDNKPLGLRMKLGQKIAFHPLDSIDWLKAKKH